MVPRFKSHPKRLLTSLNPPLSGLLWHPITPGHRRTASPLSKDATPLSRAHLVPFSCPKGVPKSQQAVWPFELPQDLKHYLSRPVMADQNISQILAALGTYTLKSSMDPFADCLTLLASQPPGSNPNVPQAPQQQPPMNQPYQATYPTPPPIASSNYNLPQPTSSGNVDLSNVKPSSSGSVSLAEAVARARGFAADRGAPFDQTRARKLPTKHPM